MAEKKMKEKRIPSGMGSKVLLGVEIFMCADIMCAFIITMVDANNNSGASSGMGAISSIPFMVGLCHAVYVYCAGRHVKTVYPKWRGYAIGTAIVLALGIAIAGVGDMVESSGLAFAGLVIICAASLLLCVYHFKTNLGKRYALTFNQLLDAGYFDELERRKKADVERETAVIIETAKDTTSQMRVPGKKVEPVKPAAPFTGKGSVAKPKAATPPEPAKSAERKPEGGEEKPTGHRLKL